MVEEHSSNDELSLNIEEPGKKSDSGFFSKLKSGLSLKMMMVFGGVLVLAAGVIIAVLVYQGGKGRAEELEIEAETFQEEVSEATSSILFDDIVKFDVVEIKLGDMGGEKLFKVGVCFKIDQQELRDELVRRESQVREIISVILKSKTYIELQGVDGKIILKNEIMKHLNESLETGHIINLFFYNYLII